MLSMNVEECRDKLWLRFSDSPCGDRDGVFGEG